MEAVSQTGSRASAGVALAGVGSASRIARSYLWAILIWLSLSPVNAGEDTVTLLDQGSFIPYWMLLLANSAWMMTAALLTPPIFALVRRYPIAGRHHAGTEWESGTGKKPPLMQKANRPLITSGC